MPPQQPLVLPLPEHRTDLSFWLCCRWVEFRGEGPGQLGTECRLSPQLEPHRLTLLQLRLETSEAQANPPAQFPSPPLHKLSVPAPNSGWDVWKKILLYLTLPIDLTPLHPLRFLCLSVLLSFSFILSYYFLPLLPLYIYIRLII